MKLSIKLCGNSNCVFGLVLIPPAEAQGPTDFGLASGTNNDRITLLTNLNRVVPEVGFFVGFFPAADLAPDIHDDLVAGVSGDGDGTHINVHDNLAARL